MSPLETTQLESQAFPFRRCPKCDHPFYPFLRGQVQRSAMRWWPFGKIRPYYALICCNCKEIVGWEMPDTRIGGKP